MRGDARKKDEQLLEKAAVSDPFLADAMEGYRQFPEGDHEAALARLKDKLLHRSGNRKGGFVLWRIAAAVALLLLAGGVFWMVNDNFGWKDSNMAYEPSDTRSENKPPAETKSLPGKQEEGSRADTAFYHETNEPESQIAQVRKAKKDPGNLNKPAPGGVNIKEPNAQAPKESPIPTSPAVVSDDLPDTREDQLKETIVLAEESTEAKTTVMDADVVNMADIEDEFQQDSINKAGMAKAPAAASGVNTKNIFTAQPDVKPAGGFQKFEQYLEQNKVLPDSVMTGEVLLQFVVEPNGKLTHIKALQYSVKVMEAEAIRLITNGPLWENNTGTSQVTEYVVKF
ncbi:MAG: hypothetical protein KDC85_19995 [Saprospiraceae bacterium]|nr:hypothetical protein [Saprospiraceae bacterium]MCB9327041.1 hypothetical protein [Lewinellaceae bacterium]